jgi:hypothetical protein
MATVLMVSVLTMVTAQAQEAATTAKESAEASQVLKHVRVIAFDLPSGTPPSGGRVVLIHLERRDQMIVPLGKTFQPKRGFLFTVDKINKDGSCYVSGTGMSMGRIRVATKAEREGWAHKLRTNGFDT